MPVKGTVSVSSLLLRMFGIEALASACGCDEFPMAARLLPTMLGACGLRNVGIGVSGCIRSRLGLARWLRRGLRRRVFSS